MVMAKLRVRREIVRRKQPGGNNGGFIVRRSNWGTAAATTELSSLEMVLRATKLAARFTSRGRPRAAKSRQRYQRSPEFFSYKANSQLDGANTRVARVETAKAGPDRSGSGAVHTRPRCANLIRAAASLETNSISTARYSPSEWRDHLSRKWRYTEQRSARIDWSRRVRRSSARKRFLFRELARIEGTGETGRNAMNHARRNPADQLADHPSPELRSARNVPASGERRKHSAKPANVEAVIAIRKLRCREVRPSKRMEIR